MARGGIAVLGADLAVGARVARHWVYRMDGEEHAPCGGEADAAASRLAPTQAGNGQDGQAWWASVVGGKSRGRRSAGSDSRA